MQYKLCSRPGFLLTVLATLAVFLAVGSASPIDAQQLLLLREVPLAHQLAVVEHPSSHVVDTVPPKNRPASIDLSSHPSTSSRPALATVPAAMAKVVFAYYANW